MDTATARILVFVQADNKWPALWTAARTSLGPIIGLMIWLLPLGLDPTAQKAFAIVTFMVIYWIAEPVDHAVTALIACYLFWSLRCRQVPSGIQRVCKRHALVSLRRHTNG
jgi:hypothetical protein